MEDSASEPTPPPTDSDQPVQQFSIGKLFVWTGLVAGGFAIFTASVSEWQELGVFLAVFWLSIYMIVVCGLWLFIQAMLNQQERRQKPKSYDFWIPTGMSAFAPLLFLLCGIISPHQPGQIGNELLETVSGLTFFLSLPYAVGSLALIYRRTMRHGFSLRFLIYCFGCWLWWMMSSVLVYLGSSGALI